MREDDAPLSDLLKSALTAAGWTPSRCTDTARVVRILKRRGYLVHDAAARILKEFAGLSFEIAHGPDRSKRLFRGRCRVIGGWHPVRAVRRRFHGWWRGLPPPDADFLWLRFNWMACLIAILDTRYVDGWERNGQVYSLPSGDVIFCSANWDMMFKANSFLVLIDSLCGGRRHCLEEIVLDTEDNNLNLQRLGLLD